MILSPSQFHRLGALFVVIPHVIDPGADGIAPHEPGIAGPEQFGRCPRILHSRIEPQVVAVRIKDDWHALVDG